MSDRKLRIALVAHDKKKDSLIQFILAYKPILEDHELYATGTTGQRIMDETKLEVTRFKSGPLGGDQEIGAAVAQDRMDLIVFFRDPLTAQPHEPDVTALIRLADVYEVPLATNMGTAEVLLKGLEAGFFDWRFIRRND